MSTYFRICTVNHWVMLVTLLGSIARSIEYNHLMDFIFVMLFIGYTKLALTQPFFRDYLFASSSPSPSLSSPSLPFFPLFLSLSVMRTHEASKVKACEALQQINIFHSHFSENKKAKLKKKRS